MNTSALKIEVWSDIACPFCYIGKRKLELALADFEHRHDVTVVFKSFQLDPNLKTEPEANSVEHLARVKGWSLEQTRKIQAQVAGMAADVGIRMDFERVVLANTYDAHRLIQFAKSLGKDGVVSENLFEAHFSSGRNIADPEVLLSIAVGAGLPKDASLEVVEGKGFSEQVDRDKAEARYLDISGVPFFLLEEQYAISGAQPEQVFKRALEKAWNDLKK